MALFDFLYRNPGAPDALIDAAVLNQSKDEYINELHSDIREIKEDLLALSDAFDNVGWSPIDLGDNDSGVAIKLDTVKKMAKLSRGLLAGNPFVKSGVEARIGYIWGRGVTFDNLSGIPRDNVKLNRKKLFTPEAYAEYERVLATDGNAFTALPLDSAPDGTTAFRIPLDQIVGAVKNPNDTEDVWYYKREYTVTVTTPNGEQQKRTTIKYYASLSYMEQLEAQGRSLPKRWRDAGVEQNFAVQHIAVNRQVGWTWGVPDIMPVVFWAKAYKEYLEDNANLVKAYSRFAWNFKAANAPGANAAAAQVMRPPERDPLTGEQRTPIGGSMIGTGVEAAPVANNASSVDFSKGSALASAIAAGLEVPLSVVAPINENEVAEAQLNIRTLKAMESRQAVHTNRFLDVFEFWGADVYDDGSNEAEEADLPQPGTNANQPVAVRWPQIESDSTKDRMTAIGTAVEEGILFKQEAREDAVKTLGITPYKGIHELPTLEDDPAAKEKADMQQQQFEQSQSAIAKQGVSGGIAAKGGNQTNNNEARDNRKSDTANK